MRVRFGKEWKPAVVVAKSPLPRSFIVQIGSQQYRRNRRDLRKLSPQQEIPYVQDIDIEDDQSAYEGGVHEPAVRSARGRIIRPNRDPNFAYY